MSKQDLLKTQTCILKVNIDCDGCKRKVRKILQKIDGVYAVAIDMQQGKVTVTGDVEPDLLIKKLEKSGKHADVWSSGKGENKSKDGELDNVNEQLKKLLQMGGGKGGGNEVMKPKGGNDLQKGGVIGGGGDGKNVQQVNFQHLLEQMRSGSKDFTVKDQKPVKADLPIEGGDDDDFGDFSGDEFDDDDDGEFDDDDEFDEDEEFDDDDDDEFDEDEEEYEDDYDDDEDEGDQHHKQQKAEKGGGGGEKAKKGGGGGGGGGGIMSMVGKVIGGNNGGKKVESPKNEGEGKNGNEGKKGGAPKNGGEGKNGNKSGGGGGGGGGAKKGGFQDLDVPTHTKGGGGGGGGGMGPVGHYQVGPMGQQFLAAPVMNGGGGYYQGMGPMGPVPGNPYQQQQYMAMMNQQRMMHGGGAAYHPAMYGRPPPGYGYVPPPAYQDHITHMFSDENPGSCSIM